LLNCTCRQDTTSDGEKDLSSCESRLLSTLRRSSSSSLLESNEAVPVADSSTMLTPAVPSTPHDHVSTATLPSTCHSHVSQSATRNRLLMQLLAGTLSDDSDTSSTDAGGISATEIGSREMPTSQSVSALTQSSWAITASSELSDDLNCVSVTDLFNAPDLLPVSQRDTVSKSDMEDHLLMAQLEHAIMNSELSLEDLDRLLAVGSSAKTAPVSGSSASTSTVSTPSDRQLMSQHHATRLGKLLLFLDIKSH